MRHIYVSEYLRLQNHTSPLCSAIDTVIRAGMLAACLESEIRNSDDDEQKKHFSDELNKAVKIMQQHAEEVERLTPNITRDNQVAGLHAA